MNAGNGRREISDRTLRYCLGVWTLHDPQSEPRRVERGHKLRDGMESWSNGVRRASEIEIMGVAVLVICDLLIVDGR